MNITNSNNFKDLRGIKFGKLTVLSRGENSKSGRVRWICRCDCAREILSFSCNLTGGKSTSCQFCKCKTHAMSDSRTYGQWSQMIERCTRKKHKYYSYYGGRGITVCDKWKKFEGFFEDMGESPYGMTLDRIDNNKGYSVDNCKWSTRKEQSRNRRISIKIGEVVNDWKIISRHEEPKTYNMQCLDCGKTRKIRSCHFRRFTRCKCSKGEKK